MSVVIKTTEMQYRDANGVYHGINAVAEKKIADQEAALDQIIANAQDSVNQMESQQQLIADRVASMAQLGTDNTLSIAGQAADAKACGDLKSAYDLCLRDDTVCPYEITDGFMKADGTVQVYPTSKNRLWKMVLPSGTASIFISGTLNFDAGSSNPWCVLWFVKNGELYENNYIPVTTKPQTWTNYEVQVPSGIREIWTDQRLTVKLTNSSVSIDYATSVKAEKVYSILRDINPSLIDSLHVYKNLYNPYDNDIEDNGYYNYLNQWTDDGNFCESGYIAVEPSEKYVFSGITKSTKLQTQIVFFDVNKQYLSGIYRSNTWYFETPSNAAYVRVPFKKTNRKIYSLCKGKDIPPIGLPYNETVVFTDSICTKMLYEDNFDKIKMSLRDGLFPYRIADGFMKADGVLHTEYASGAGRLYKYEVPSNVGSIYISGSSDLSAAPDNPNPWCVLWFVKDGVLFNNNYVPATTYPQSWDFYEVQIPSGSEEIWALSNMILTTEDSIGVQGNVTTDLNILKYEVQSNPANFEGSYTWSKRVFGLRILADAQGCYFIPFNALGLGVNRGNGLHGNDYVVDNIHPTLLGAYNVALGVWSYLKNIPCWYTSIPSSIIQPLDGTQWNGKKWYAYGTSLTATSTGFYAEYVATMSGMILTNKGLGGSALVTNRNMYNRLMDTTDGKLEADLITIEVGANDIGDLGLPWSLDINTFYGALNHCIQTMFEAGVQAQIVIMASYPARYNIYHTSEKYNVDHELNT